MVELKTAREIFSEVCRSPETKETASRWRIAMRRDNDGKKFWAGVKCCDGKYGVLTESTQQRLRKRIEKTETEWNTRAARLVNAAQLKFRQNLIIIRKQVRSAVELAGVTKGRRTLVADIVRKIQYDTIDENAFTKMTGTAFVEAVEKFGTVLD